MEMRKLTILQRGHLWTQTQHPEMEMRKLTILQLGNWKSKMTSVKLEINFLHYLNFCSVIRKFIDVARETVLIPRNIISTLGHGILVIMLS